MIYDNRTQFFIILQVYTTGHLSTGYDSINGTASVTNTSIRTINTMSHVGINEDLVGRLTTVSENAGK